MGNIPIVFSDVVNKSGLCNICNKCIETIENDWNAFETSWDFKRNPLL